MLTLWIKYDLNGHWRSQKVTFRIILTLTYVLVANFWSLFFFVWIEVERKAIWYWIFCISISMLISSGKWYYNGRRIIHLNLSKTFVFSYITFSFLSWWQGNQFLIMSTYTYIIIIWPKLFSPVGTQTRR